MICVRIADVCLLFQWNDRALAHLLCIYNVAPLTEALFIDAVEGC